LDESLSLARQIAEALEEAHEKGIIHRDLKPQNIKITPNGRVKVLDFGLAKALDPAGSAAGMTPHDLAHSPTVTFGGTREGIILGTAAYMAPEQARGGAVDRRADIWSFGVVLYEMLTGERLFAEGSVVDTLSAVMRKEIDLGRLSPSTPVRLRELLRRCLTRDPKERLRDIGEARFALTEGFAEVSPTAVASSDHERGAPRRALAFALVVAAGGVAFGLWRGLAPPRAAAPFTPRSVLRLTDLPGVETSPTISPDGKSVVYAAGPAGERDLFLLRVGGRNPNLLTPESPGDDWQPAYSPDGTKIAFRSSRDGGGIFVMEATGESVRRLTETGFDPCWSPDGREIAFSQRLILSPTDRPAAGTGIGVVRVDSGEQREIEGVLDGFEPAWSPHGDRLAYWGLSRAGGGQRDIFTVAASGSGGGTERSAVLDDAPLDWSPVWSPDGRALYFASDRGGAMNLWRIAIDEKTGRSRGIPEPVTVPSAWAGRISLSADGARLAYETLDWRSRLLRVGFDPVREEIVGEPKLLLERTRAIRDHQVSPDGSWLAFVELGEGEALQVARIDGRESRSLTQERVRDRGPAWSPDGERIAFFSDRSGAYEIWTVHPDGSHAERWTDLRGVFNPVWSPDGKQLAVTVFGGGHAGWRIVEADAVGLPKPSSEAPAIPGEGGDRFVPWSWSRDGAKLAGHRILADGRAGDLYIYRFADRSYSAVGLTVAADWRFPVWLRDGRRLLFRDGRGIAMIDTESRRVKRLIDVGGYFLGRSIGVGSDETTITYSETATEGDVWIAELGAGGSAP
jgi:Tol biopolymer transport system component